MLDGHVVQRKKPEDQEERKLHHHKIKGNIQESCNFPSFMVRITTFVYPKAKMHFCATLARGSVLTLKVRFRF